VTDFVEVGPGRVLSGLIRRISPDATVHTVDGAGAPFWTPAGEPQA
jgi:malonyl CoA-acyl carrier protein transacylase